MRNKLALLCPYITVDASGHRFRATTCLLAWRPTTREHFVRLCKWPDYIDYRLGMRRIIPLFLGCICGVRARKYTPSTLKKWVNIYTTSMGHYFEEIKIFSRYYLFATLYGSYNLSLVCALSIFFHVWAPNFS